MGIILVQGSILETFCLKGQMGHFLGCFLTFQSHLEHIKDIYLKKIVPMCLHDDFGLLYKIKFFIWVGLEIECRIECRLNISTPLNFECINVCRVPYMKKLLSLIKFTIIMCESRYWVKKCRCPFENTKVLQYLELHWSIYWKD